MIRGVGTDIVRIAKVENALGPRFLQRVYTPREQAYIESKGKLSAQTAAGLFAAKEAVMKALGTGLTGVSFTDIEIAHDGQGAPRAAVSGSAGAFHVSISHEGDYACAFCVWEDA